LTMASVASASSRVRRGMISHLRDDRFQATEES
jgi:hypothetical protein